jgi:hypothetical protein
MEFCHIAPTSYLNLVSERRHHLTLAHILYDEIQTSGPKKAGYKGQNKEARYTNFYKRRMNLNIMDNGAFELYKSGEPMFPAELLVQMAESVNANYIVLPDHPAHPSMVGIDEAMRYAPLFKEAGFGTFFVPQSDIGDLEDLITSFAWGASSPFIDYIGISILAVPNAYDCEKGNTLQRFNSRWKFMNELRGRGLLEMAYSNGKKIHMLGLVDGPNEIALLKDFHIDTWDSSAAIWCGLNGIGFDKSPTGLVDGKFEKPVDFDHEGADDDGIALAMANMNYIDVLSEGVA